MEYEQLGLEHEDWKNYADMITFNLPMKLKKKGENRPFIRDNHAKDFIKVPFKIASSLVGGKQCFIRKGKAFVHIDDLNTIARSLFKEKMFGELARAYKFLSTILQDPRLQKLLIDLSNHNSIDFNLQDVSAPKDLDKINLSDLNYYQRKAFPPCMKALFTALSNQSHLKHFGRL